MKEEAQNLQVTLEEFISRVDCYLVEDLKTLIDLPIKSCGSAAYPCLQTIISGMELMGMLISGEEDRLAFESFWEEMENCDPRYSPELGKLVRQVVRNGTAHYFLVKRGVGVVLGKRSLHLKFTRDEELIISCKGLYNDFIKTYEIVKAKLLANPNEAFLKKFLHDFNQGSHSVSSYYKSLGITREMFNNESLVPPNLRERLHYGEIRARGVSRMSPGKTISFAKEDSDNNLEETIEVS